MPDGWGSAYVDDNVAGTTIIDHVPADGGYDTDVTTDCGITDTWTRTVASGWGTSDAVLAWFAPSGFTGDFAEVDGSRGVLHNGTTDFGGQWVGQVASLTLSPAASHDYYVEFQMQDALVPSVTFQKQRISMRWLASSTFPATFSIWGDEWALDAGDASASGLWAVNPGTTVHAIRAHAETIAGQTTFSVKMWALSDPEPGAWLATVAATHSGSPVSYDLSGLDLILGPGDTGLISPNAVYFDNLNITGVTRCTEYHYDDFNRVNGSDWGTSDYGIPWDVVGANTDNFVSINGTEGSFRTQDGGPSFSARAIDGPWANPVGWTMKARFRMPARPTFFDWDLSFQQSWTGRSLHIYVDYLTNSPWDVDQLSIDGSDVLGPDVAHILWVPGTWYTLVWHWERPSLSQAKIWADGDPEPTDWQVAIDYSAFGDDGDPTQQPGGNEFSVNFDGRGNPGDNAEFLLDYIYFTRGSQLPATPPIIDNGDGTFTVTVTDRYGPIGVGRGQ